MRWSRRLLTASIALAGACAAEDPESALGALVGEAERAAESRDTGFFRDLIAPSYVDGHGNDRDRMVGLIRAYFVANQNVEVFTRVERIALLGGDAAEMSLLAGIVGRRPPQGVLRGLDGRLYRLEIELVRAGDGWQAIGADWQRSDATVVGQ